MPNWRFCPTAPLSCHARRFLSIQQTVLTWERCFQIRIFTFTDVRRLGEKWPHIHTKTDIKHTPSLLLAMRGTKRRRRLLGCLEHTHTHTEALKKCYSVITGQNVCEPKDSGSNTHRLNKQTDNICNTVPCINAFFGCSSWISFF